MKENAVEQGIVELNAQAAPEDSFRRRYLAKLLTNVAGAPVGLAAQFLAPRMAGPAGYGAYTLLNSFFQSLVTFLDAGASTHFYAKLSQRPSDNGLKRFIWYLVTALSVCMVVFVAAVSAVGWSNWFWPDKKNSLVWLALSLAVTLWIGQIIGKMVDAHGLTVGGERMRFGQKLIGLGLLASVYLVGWRSVEVLFVYNLVMAALLAAAWWWVLRQRRTVVFPRRDADERPLESYWIESWIFSKPLLVCAACASIAYYGERWILERSAGSQQQGYFGLAYTVTLVCSMFINALSPLFMREITVAHAKGDLDRMRSLYRRCVPMLYLVAAYFSMFTCVEADKIVVIAGGDEFADAGTTLIIYALVPIHQIYGQMNGSFFFATGNTKAYRNIDIIITLSGLLLTGYLVSPARFGGLDLGARGLAAKMLIVQFLCVNVQLLWITRLIHCSFWKFVAHQFLVVVLLGGLALLVRFAFVQRGLASWSELLLAGISYSLLTVLAVWAMPRLAGSSRSELRALLRWKPA